MSDHDSYGGCICTHLSHDVTCRESLARPPDFDRRGPLLGICFRRCEGAQAQSSAKPRYRLATLIEPEFAIGRLRVHLLTLSDSQGLGFKVGSGQPVATFSRRHSGRPHQPFLQDADATEAPLVQEFPIAHEVWPVLKGKLFLEGSDNIDKGLAIFRIFGTVACQVNVDASSAELTVQISER